MTSLPDGVFVGQYKDGRDIYVGRGRSIDERLLLGRISLNPDFYGLYYAFDDIEFFTKIQVEYLSKGSNCNCDFVRCNQCDSIPNVYEFSNLPYSKVPSWVARENVKYKCEDLTCSYTTFGIVEKPTVLYFDENGREIYRHDGIYDVLKCDGINNAS